MKIQVQVHTLKQGRDVPVGTIALEGNEYVLDPDDSLILNNLLETVMVSRDGQRIDSDSDKFLEVLHEQYRSPYLRVTQPEFVAWQQQAQMPVRPSLSPT